MSDESYFEIQKKELEIKQKNMAMEMEMRQKELEAKQKNAEMDMKLKEKELNISAERNQRELEARQKSAEMDINFKEKELNISAERSHKELEVRQKSTEMEMMLKEKELNITAEHRKSESNAEIIKINAKFAADMKQVAARLREVRITKEYELAIAFMKISERLLSVYDIDAKILQYGPYITAENKIKNPEQYNLAVERCEALTKYDAIALLTQWEEKYDKIRKTHGQEFDRQMSALLDDAKFTFPMAEDITDYVPSDL